MNCWVFNLEQFMVESENDYDGVENKKINCKSRRKPWYNSNDYISETIYFIEMIVCFLN